MNKINRTPTPGTCLLVTLFTEKPNIETLSSGTGKNQVTVCVEKHYTPSPRWYWVRLSPKDLVVSDQREAAGKFRK